MNIFIPFVESYIPTYKIEETMKSQQFGKVISIELHDKKINKKNGRKNNLTSAKHNYAFITIELFDTTQGNNMRTNLLYNKSTHIMFNYNQQLVHLQLKPHLSVEDRLERGFELHIPKQSVKCPENNENTEPLPEWFNSELSSSFSFEFGKLLPNKLSLTLPTMTDFILYDGEIAPRNKLSSFYNNDIEKQMIDSDYYELMDEVDRERNNFQQFSLLPV